MDATGQGCKERGVENGVSTGLSRTRNMRFLIGFSPSGLNITFCEPVVYPTRFSIAVFVAPYTL